MQSQKKRKIRLTIESTFTKHSKEKDPKPEVL
jgi:hypothetical protein